MGNLSKTFALILMLIIAISCIAAFIIEPTNAQSIPKPTVPEFSLRFTEHPFDTPTTTTTTINPYTGEQTVTVHGGYRVENKSIDVLIKNQQLSGLNDSYHVYFNIRIKPHYSNTWVEIYPSYNGTTPQNPLYGYVTFITGPIQSTSEFTIISYSSDWQYTPSILKTAMCQLNTEVDFQVQAIIGHDSLQWVSDHPLAPELGGSSKTAVMSDTNSEWSYIQTLTMPAEATSNQTPTAPEFSWLAILFLLFCMLFVAVVSKYRKVSIHSTN